MRRLLSITLFAVLLLPLLAPLFASSAEAQSGVPACCRREGKHRCMMGAVAVVDAQRGFRSPREECPYRQRGLAASHHERVVIAVAEASTRMLVVEPSVIARAECLWRISFDRSRQKRGPPTLVS